MMIDPDGRYTSQIQSLKDSMPNIYSGWEYVDGINFGDWHNFASGAQFSAFVQYVAANGGGGGSSGTSGNSSALLSTMLGLGAGTWTNTGYGFESNDHIALGYDGSYLSLNTLLDGYINIPEVVLTGNSSTWGSQMQNHFNNFVTNAWNGTLPSNGTIDAIINNKYYGLGSLGLDQAIAKTGSYLTKALETKSSVSFTVLNEYAKPAFRTNVAGSMLGTSKVEKFASGLKVAGNVLAGVGVAVSAYQYSSGQISGLEFGVDTAVTIIGFMGPVGAGFSLVYFGAKAISEYNGYQWFDKP